MTDQSRSPRPVDAAPVRRVLCNSPEFRAAWNAGQQIEAMAAHYGVSTFTIRRRAQEWGLAARGKKSAGPITEAERAQIVALRDGGATLSEITVATGRSMTGVRGALRKANAGPRPNPAPAPAPVEVEPEDLPQVAGAPFWTPARDAQVIETQGRYRAMAELADRLGLSSTRINARWHLLKAA